MFKNGGEEKHLGYKMNEPLGEGNYRVIGQMTSKDFLDEDGKNDFDYSQAAEVYWRTADNVRILVFLQLFKRLF